MDVDIGGTTVKIGLFSTDGTLLDKWEIPTRTENQGERILPDVAQALQNKMTERKIGSYEMRGIGIGIPAPVMENGIVQKTANLGWGYKEVCREMEELTGLKAAAGNDANVAAAWRDVAGSRRKASRCSHGYTGNRCRRRDHH